MDTRRWEILSKLKTRSSKFKIQDIARILLKNRGIETEKERKEFFNPTRPEVFELGELGISKVEIEKAIKRIRTALKSKEKVFVYGDYDADGICGTAILWETLYDLGLNVLPYIPERFSEGYGLNIESIKKLKVENPDLGLIITVDHGIVANKKVDIARELGVDVIITDHHEPGKKKPKPLALIHTIEIGGAAVAWVFAREILKKLKKSRIEELKNSLELVAIGTIADQLPLIRSNRSFAKHGLEVLNKTKRIGLLALLKQASIAPESVGPYQVGFLIAPRLNAMGRLEHAMESLRLLCTKNRSRADELSRHLNKVNLERQRVVDEVVLHARSQVRKDSSGIIVLAHETYHEGVIGLAASRLVEEFYRPAIVISKKGEVAKASARSISGFNIIQAIRKVEDLLLEGGGHPMAAGFSIKTVMIEKFSKRLNQVSVPLLTEEILTKTLKIDLETHFNQMNLELLTTVKNFEPTGLGNPSPTFTTKNVKVLDARTVGKDAAHLKLKLEEGGIILDSIAFGKGSLYQEIEKDELVDIAYNLEENMWSNKRSLELKIKDLRTRNGKRVSRTSGKN